ncbi:phage portal protein, partial [Staphylococcus pseudintermedius]|uniref:phage portal protein n=1 Tax=Staphylococcus pseudintermedius TaxID=283734 RepID=UPI000E26FA21
IQCVRNQLNDPIDLSHMRIEYKPNIPQSLTEYADICIKLGGSISQETLLSWLPNIENPKEELEKVKEEEQDNHNDHDTRP